MANLLGILVTWITFPGVILHEWSHKFFCDRAGIPVYEVKYFRFGNPAGYVRHGEVTRYRDAFLITIAPFIVNTLCAIAMFIVPALNVDATLKIPFIWLGLSFAIHAFPSDGDAGSLWAHSKRMWRKNPVALIGFPLVIIIMLVNLLRFFWIDLIYGVVLLGVTFGLVSAVIASGTPLFPGLSAMVVSPTPHPAPAYHYTSGTPTPVPVQIAPGSEAPAKDWLSVAQDAMKGKNDKAVLINVDGRSNDAGIALPINGKCHVWKYVYASQPDDLVYDVIVRDGKLESLDTRKLSQTSVEKITFSYGDPGIKSWNVDSVEAVRISNEKFKEVTGLDAPASAAYSLELSSWHRLTWTIYNYDSTSRVIADISIDQETSEISHTWAPKA
ncbi:MAG TPA: DUF3267 domain-containing protein [Methanocella sp.]|jgi:hypothetical protein